MEIFEDEKKNQKYYDRAELLKQQIEISLPIDEALILRYFLQLMFHNAINFSSYMKNALYNNGMSKKIRDEKLYLKNKWFNLNNIC